MESDTFLFSFYGKINMEKELSDNLLYYAFFLKPQAISISWRKHKFYSEFY